MKKVEQLNPVSITVQFITINKAGIITDKAENEVEEHLQILR